MAEPRPGRPFGHADPVAGREAGDVGLIHRGGGRPSPRPSRAGRATPNARRLARIRAAPAESVAAGAPTAGWSPSGTSRTAPGAPGYRHRYGPRAPRRAGYRAR